MSKPVATFQRLLTSQSAAAGSEYAICLGLIVIVVVALLCSIGGLGSTLQVLSESVASGARCSDGESIVSLQGRSN